MSTFLNCVPEPPPQAASAVESTAAIAASSRRLEKNVMVNEQRGEQGRQVEDREPERAARERVAVREIEPARVHDEQAVQRERRAQVEPSAHAVGERQQRGG